MGAQPDSAPKAARRGFVLGELLIAALLLAVAISSLTALMYSVTRNPRVRTHAEAECTEKGSATSPKCATQVKSSGSGSKLLVAGCASRSGSKVRACNDSVITALASEGTILRSRTDPASLAMLPKKAKRTKRPDLGFIR